MSLLREFTDSNFTVPTGSYVEAVIRFIIEIHDAHGKGTKFRAN